MEKNVIRQPLRGNPIPLLVQDQLTYLQLVAETVDEQINQIKSLTDNLELDKMAVLTAVNAVSDQLEMQIEMEKMRQKITELETKLAKFEEG